LECVFAAAGFIDRAPAFFFFAGFFEVAGFFLRCATGSPYPSGANAKQLLGEPLNELITACTATLFDINCEVGVSNRMERFMRRGRYPAHHSGVVGNEFGGDAFAEFHHCLVGSLGTGSIVRVGLHAAAMPSPPFRK